jgi:hypothetical protein
MGGVWHHPGDGEAPRRAVDTCGTDRAGWTGWSLHTTWTLGAWLARRPW